MYESEFKIFNFNAFSTSMDGIESIVRGLANTMSAKFDLSIADELQNHLKTKSAGQNLDLASLNINRGRDHGLPGYAKYVEYCSGLKLTSFEDLSNKFNWEQEIQNKVASVYDSVEDIDLWIGLLSERVDIGSSTDSIAGSTLTCLLLEQFARLKKGDRFYYENRPDASIGTENSAFTIGKIFIL